MQCKWKIKGHENETKKIRILLLRWSEHHTEAFCGYPEGRKLTGVDQINGEGHWSEEEAKIDIIISEIKHKKSVPFEDLYMFTSTLCNHTIYKWRLGCTVFDYYSPQKILHYPFGALLTELILNRSQCQRQLVRESMSCIFLLPFYYRTVVV